MIVYWDKGQDFGYSEGEFLSISNTFANSMMNCLKV